MSISDAKRLKELELENSRLKRLLAESMLVIGHEADGRRQYDPQARKELIEAS